MRIVDTREPDYIRDELLMTGWEQKALKHGDYKLLTAEAEKVGITRKTVPDLLGSLTNKTFATHLDEMIPEYPIRIILIEGSWQFVSTYEKLITQRGIEYSTFQQVWNFLLTWSLQGFAIQLTTNEGHTIRRLNQLYAYFQKPYHTGGLDHNRVTDQRIFAFPSKYRKQGKLLLDESWNLMTIGSMSIHELQSYNGVGSKGAEAIYNHFHRRS